MDGNDAILGCNWASAVTDLRADSILKLAFFRTNSDDLVLS